MGRWITVPGIPEPGALFQGQRGGIPGCYPAPLNLGTFRISMAAHEKLVRSGIYAALRIR